MKTKKKKISLLLSISIFVLLVAVIFLIPEKEKQVERDLPQIQNIGTVKVATAFDPIGYYVSGDSIAGFDSEMLKALEKMSGLKFEITPINTLNESLNGLLNGQFDLVARNIVVNAEMRNNYLFTKSIVHNKLILVQRKKEYNDSIAPLRSHLQLAKKTIHITLNSPAKLRLSNLIHEIGDTLYIVENERYNPSQLAMMVAAKEIDYAICDERTADLLASKLPELEVNTDIGFTHLESWAVRKSSPILLDSIDFWISKYMQTVDFEKLYTKYYK